LDVLEFVTTVVMLESFIGHPGFLPTMSVDPAMPYPASTSAWRHARANTRENDSAAHQLLGNWAFQIPVMCIAAMATTGVFRSITQKA
jgi:hypothetical protein